MCVCVCVALPSRAEEGVTALDGRGVDVRVEASSFFVDIDNRKKKSKWKSWSCVFSQQVGWSLFSVRLQM